MPRIGDLELLDPNTACGGAFLTTRPSRVDFEREGPDVGVQARNGSRWVVVKLHRAVAPADLLAAALGEAELALDLLGREGHFLELDAPHTDHLLWWQDADGPRLRAAHLTLFEAPKIGVVLRGEGSPTPPPPPPSWHPLLRFYRLAHLTEDPIERFRYLYLGSRMESAPSAPKIRRKASLRG